MCECFNYDDGSKFLCVPCANEYEDKNKTIARLYVRGNEIEKRIKQLEEPSPAFLTATTKIGELMAEIERLRAENDRLAGSLTARDRESTRSAFLDAAKMAKARGCSCGGFYEIDHDANCPHSIAYELSRAAEGVKDE